MRKIRQIVLIIPILSLLSCSMLAMKAAPPPAETDPARILIVVNQSILTSISEQLAIYSDDIISEGGTVEIRPFLYTDTVENLKLLILSHRETINGVLLIGNLPTAWYEQNAFGVNEIFPIELYLMDLDAVWNDKNNNRIYDSHSPLKLSIYTSRITGTIDELNGYFSKIHNYRTGNYEYLGGAFIFKDDDWFNTYRGSNFGLDLMYSQVKIFENSAETQKENYLHRLSNNGADYVYQWIHSTPSSLYINHNGSYSIVRNYDISANNIRGRFLNMFNCKGARYTQTNLAMTYLMNTETGIAVTGSTKVGGNYFPLEFHRTLTLGSSWGNAFKSWYNYFGSKNDEWFLGMTILGDPTITIQDSHIDRSLSRSSFTSIIPLDEKTILALERSLSDFVSLETTF